MPPSVANAAPTATIPFNLARSYVLDREYAVAINDYADGSTQRRAMASTPRRRWKIAHRLAAAALAELRAVYVAAKGPHGRLYFYDVHETDPPFSYDETGVAEAGRYAVHFAGEWDQTVQPGLSDCGVELVEVA